MTLNRLILTLTFILSMAAFIGCTTPAVDPPSSGPAESLTTAQAAPSNDLDSYPAVAGVPTVDPSYPVEPSPLELTAQPIPQDPERNLPQPGAEFGVIGGVLVQEISDIGYIPMVPKVLRLANVLYTDSGSPAYISAGDESQSAELFQTGIFLFNQVPAGEYGLVVDLGFTQIAAPDENGDPLVFTIEAGQALDLGQIIISLE